MGEVKRYTQGVCMDGAAILLDGKMQTIEEILGALNSNDAMRAEAYLHEVRLADAYESLELLRTENAELVEALRLAANRLDRLTLEVSGGYWRSSAAEWTGEARAALAKHRGE